MDVVFPSRSCPFFSYSCQARGAFPLLLLLSAHLQELQGGFPTGVRSQAQHIRGWCFARRYQLLVGLTQALGTCLPVLDCWEHAPLCTQKGTHRFLGNVGQRNQPVNGDPRHALRLKLVVGS